MFLTGLYAKGFLRCLDTEKDCQACVKTELTLQGHHLLENKKGKALVKAIKTGSLELAAGLVVKILIG